MDSMMAYNRKGNLNQLYHMFAYLCIKHNSSLVFDLLEPNIDESHFPREYWSASAYGECSEDTPPNIPKPHVIGFTMQTFVESDHAGELPTQRSRTGFIIYINSDPIYWFYKRQVLVEKRSSGSEFIAMKQCCEYVLGLRYKLCMMGIPVDLTTYILGDNQSVLVNTSKHHSTLKNKSVSIDFHYVRKGTTKDELITAYVKMHLNPDDMLTKSLPSGQKRSYFLSFLLHYIN